MTREEEIKARLEKENAFYLDSYDVSDFRAEDDIRYLLARNEELQRRVSLLTDALREIKNGEVEAWDDGEEQIIITNMDEDEMQKIAADALDELAALDAKEQDDD